MPTREDELNQALEAMHFGYRAMIFKPDQRLAQLGLARIHHRLLYFIGRNPDCSVNRLLQIMRVSKQYLHRPLKQLIEQKYVRQTTDLADRRVKRLCLTNRGNDLEIELSDVQRRRFAEIFTTVGPVAEKHWHRVMAQLGNQIEF